MKNAFEYEAELTALRQELRTQTLRGDAAVGDANDAEQLNRKAVALIRYLIPVIDPMAFVAIGKAKEFIDVSADQ